MSVRTSVRVPASSPSAPPSRSVRQRGRRPIDLLVVVPTLVLLVIIVFPVLWMVYSSLRPAGAIATSLSWSSALSGLGVDAYRRLFTESNFGRYLGNSVVVSTIATCCTVVLSAIAGYALSRYRFRLRTTVLMLVLATQLLPFVVLITPIYLAFSEVGLLNSYVGIVVVYTAMTLPMGIYLMMGYLNVIPQVLDEAARIDGCSTLGVIFRVIMPVAVPGIVTVAVTAFIATWEEFLFATVLLTSDSLKTVQVGLAGFFGEYSTDWSLVMAAATVAAIPTVVLFFLVQKRLVAGMAAGSVKE